MIISNQILSDGVVERNANDTTEEARPPLIRQPTFASMSGGLRGWLGSMTARNRSGESVDAILPEGHHPRALSVVSGVEGRRPDLHSRRKSRGSQLVRERSSYRALRNRAANDGPNVIVASPNDSRFRFTAVIPFVLSAAAFGFSLVLVLAGSKAGSMTDVNIIQAN